MIGATIVNGRFDIIRTSRCWGKFIEFFDKSLKTSRKDSLELQKNENWTTVACIELIEASRSKKVKHTEMKNSFSYTEKKKTQTPLKTFCPRQNNKILKNSRKQMDEVTIIWYQRVHFFQRRHSKVYYEDTLQNPKIRKLFLLILFLSPLKLNQRFRTLRHDITDIIK